MSAHSETGRVSTIYEVAKHAGVSTATVSRVMSGPKEAVSPSTRERVMRAVAVLGYTPNSAAKNLRTLRSGKLLVTVPDISNPFFSLILQGIEDAAHARGLRGAPRRHAARRDARGTLRAHAQAQGSRRADLPRPPAAERGRGARPGDARRAARRSSTAASSARASACRACTSTTRRPPHEAMGHLYDLGHRRIARRHRAAREPAQPRSAARRDGARDARRAPSRLRRRCTATSRSSRASPPPSSCFATHAIVRRPSSASTTRWRWA